MPRVMLAVVKVTLGSLLLAPGVVHAQRGLPIEADRPVLRLETTKPIFGVGRYRDAHVATTALDATVLLPVHPAIALFGQLGVTVAQYRGLGWSAATSSPRLGAAFGRSRGLGASVYTDLPMSREMGNDFASGVGHFTYFEDWARYRTRTWGLGGSATAEIEMAAGTFAGARLDGTLVVPLEDGTDRDGFGVLTLYADAPTGRARIWLEVSCFALFTQPSLSLHERTTFFGTVSLSLPTSRFAPEGYVQVPLDEDVSEVIAFVVGARFHIGSTRGSR